MPRLCAPWGSCGVGFFGRATHVSPLAFICGFACLLFACIGGCARRHACMIAVYGRWRCRPSSTGVVLTPLPFVCTIKLTRARLFTPWRQPYASPSAKHAIHLTAGGGRIHASCKVQYVASRRLYFAFTTLCGISRFGSASKRERSAHV